MIGIIKKERYISALRGYCEKVYGGVVMEYLVYLAYPALAAVLLVGCRIYGRGKWNEDFMNLAQTKYIEGFFAICIMLHHIGQEMCGSWQQYPLYHGLDLFVPLGFLFVAVFMFFSGYGLYISVEKRPDYLSKGFLKRKALPLIIGYYVTFWVYLAARYFMGQNMSRRDVILYAIGFMQSNPYGWFAIVMPLLYLIFYVVFRLCKRYRIPLVVLCIVVYQYIGTLFVHSTCILGGEWWYNSVHLFWIGLVIAKYRTKLYDMVKKLYLVLLIACAAGVYGSWQLAALLRDGRGMYYTERVADKWVVLSAEMLVTTLFVFLILLLGMKIRIGNRVMDFFGKITLEFYLVHGFVIEFFSYSFCDVTHPIVRITNGALMIVVVTALSIPLAFGLKKICFIFNRKK